MISLPTRPGCARAVPAGAAVEIGAAQDLSLSLYIYIYIYVYMYMY